MTYVQPGERILPQRYRSATIMLEEDLYLAVLHSLWFQWIDPFNRHERCRLHLSGWFQTHPSDHKQLALWKQDFPSPYHFWKATPQNLRNLIAKRNGHGFWPACSWGPLTSNFGSSPGHFPVKLSLLTRNAAGRSS